MEDELSLFADEIVKEENDYDSFLQTIKDQIRTVQLDAALAVSRRLILLYWQIGSEILQRQSAQGWGAKIVQKLANDLRIAFPAVEGFSRTNLLYARSFAEAYPDRKVLQHLLQQSPVSWSHHTRILDKVKNPKARLWYVRAASENGWSRSILELQIESDLYTRQGSAVTNFDRTLPPLQSDLARQILKDPYNFDFLALGKDAHERELENGLMAHLKSFLLEMGQGFALLGTQYPLTVGDKDYFLDLLFYHVRLRCYVVIDLKMTAFEPEHAGKMNFYLSAVDDLLRHPQDEPSIGIILCKERDKVTAEYALNRMTAPIGVSSFTTTRDLPESLAANLPTIAQLEAQLRVGGDYIGTVAQSEAQGSGSSAV